MAVSLFFVVIVERSRRSVDHFTLEGTIENLICLLCPRFAPIGPRNPTLLDAEIQIVDYADG